MEESGYWPKIKDLLVSKRKELLLLSFGFVFLLIGVFFLLSQNKDEDKIEIISAETNETPTKDKIMADIEGAVVKPGVYELSFGSRVDELLISAGGLSNEADREWVEKTLNRAQKLTDGVKIYVPRKGETLLRQGFGGQGAVEGKLQTSLVNINSASLAELDKLPGIGPVTAQKIIDGRPYVSIESLQTQKILSKTVYQKIKDLLTLY